MQYSSKYFFETFFCQRNFLPNVYGIPFPDLCSDAVYICHLDTRPDSQFPLGQAARLVRTCVLKVQDRSLGSGLEFFYGYCFTRPINFFQETRPSTCKLQPCSSPKPLLLISFLSNNGIYKFNVYGNILKKILEIIE